MRCGSVRYSDVKAECPDTAAIVQEVLPPNHEDSDHFKCLGVELLERIRVGTYVTPKGKLLH